MNTLYLYYSHSTLHIPHSSKLKHIVGGTHKLLRELFGGDRKLCYFCTDKRKAN